MKELIVGTLFCGTIYLIATYCPFIFVIILALTAVWLVGLLITSFIDAFFGNGF